MTSKESLENICNGCKRNGCVHRVVNNHCVNYEDIDQDLDRLEKLEKEYKEARKSIKSWNENGGELLRENVRLKKVIEILKSYRLKTGYVEGCHQPIITFTRSQEGVVGITIEEYDLLKEYL